MGQLETYTMQDVFLIAVVSGLLSTYFAEEIEATIESVAAYIYSSNFLNKKRVKLTLLKVSVGELNDARHESFNFLRLVDTNFISIDRTLESRLLWQDVFKNSWNSTSVSSFTHLNNKKMLKNA